MEKLNWTTTVTGIIGSARSDVVQPVIEFAGNPQNNGPNNGPTTGLTTARTIPGQPGNPGNPGSPGGGTGDPKPPAQDR